MTRPARMEGGCWPTPTQELLLRAALAQGEEALSAWRAWHACTDIEHLDHGSARLLPLLAANLKQHGVERSALMRYQSVGRHAWVRHQLLLAKVIVLLRLLEHEGIPILVLKGSALGPLYYPSPATRPMNDFDFLVLPRDAARACRLLLAHGYSLHGPGGEIAHIPGVIERMLSVFHDATFTEPGDGEFDLHEHVLPYSSAPDADEAFWAASIPLQIGGIATRALCGEDALLHTCAHGIRWNQVPPLRWIADATLILRGTLDFNWERLITQTHRHHLTIPVRMALGYLNDLDLGLPIPAAALRELKRIPTSRAQRREWSALGQAPAKRSVVLSLWLRGRDYGRWNGLQPEWQRPFSLPRYLQIFWGLESLSQLPTYGLNRLKSHLEKS